MPVSKIMFPFPIDGVFRPVFQGPMLRHWHEAAEFHGFSLIGRAVDRLNVVLGCHTCGCPTLKRISVVLGHTPECPHCIHARRVSAATQMGATFIGSDPEGDRHYGVFELACGHACRRQYLRVEAAAAGGHQLGCDLCLDARYAAEAEAHDWQLLSAAVRKNPGYRRYEHVCGHVQDVAVINMKYGDVNCASCEESWASKPSRIYIFSFKLPDLPVIKLGYSSNPEFRLRQVQTDPEQTPGKVTRVIEMETGHRAICIEKALHAHIRKHRPDLIVPQDAFRDHIKTTSEIYHRHGIDYISGLLDALEAGWDPSRKPPPDSDIFFCV